jgi:hypothetical protein
LRQNGLPPSIIAPPDYWGLRYNLHIYEYKIKRNICGMRFLLFLCTPEYGGCSSVGQSARLWLWRSPVRPRSSTLIEKPSGLCPGGFIFYLVNLVALQRVSQLCHVPVHRNFWSVDLLLTTKKFSKYFVADSGLHALVSYLF